MRMETVRMLPQVLSPMCPIVQGTIGGEVLALFGQVQGRAAVVVPVLHLRPSAQQLQHHLTGTVSCGKVQGRSSIRFLERKVASVVQQQPHHVVVAPSACVVQGSAAEVRVPLVHVEGFHGAVSEVTVREREKIKEGEEYLCVRGGESGERKGGGECVFALE